MRGVSRGGLPDLLVGVGAATAEPVADLASRGCIFPMSCRATLRKAGAFPKNVNEKGSQRCSSGLDPPGLDHRELDLPTTAPTGLASDSRHINRVHMVVPLIWSHVPFTQI